MSQLSSHSIPSRAHALRLRRGRRRGVALIYTAFGMIALLGAGALTTDLGILYVRRSQAQRTADAAALAGAYQLATVKGSKAVREQQADAWARYYAELPKNGAFKQGVNGAKVTIIMTPKDETGKVRNNWIEAQVSRPEPLFFGFFKSSNQTVFAKATALYETLADIDIKGVGTYGTAPGPVNLAVFGPDSWYNNGDYLSTKKLTDTTTDNREYQTDGYDFAINIPKNFGDSTIEIFDPDCYNAGNLPSAGGTGPDGLPLRVDELRTFNGVGNGTSANATTTLYSLYDDKGTPSDPSDDGQPLFQRSYGGADSASDMKWNTVFEGNRQYLPNSNFRLNVKTTAGSSENGFDLRVGPKRSTGQAFNANNGAKVVAQGHLPINFNTSGTVKITLGTIPVEAAGGDLTIRKFDTDVGSKSIVYTCSTLPGKSWPGKLSSDGTFASDVIGVPDEYKTAGTWYAEYVAGSNDTSVWDMSYANYGPGKPGRIKLIR